MHSRIIGAVRRHSPAPVLRNADFFNDRILHKITPAPAPAPAAPTKTHGLFSLWRLAFAGAAGLIAMVAIWASLISLGAARPGMSAVVMTMSCLAMWLLTSSAWAFWYSSDISVA